MHELNQIKRYLEHMIVIVMVMMMRKRNVRSFHQEVRDSDSDQKLHNQSRSWWEYILEVTVWGLWWTALLTVVDGPIFSRMSLLSWLSFMWLWWQFLGCHGRHRANNIYHPERISSYTVDSNKLIKEDVQCRRRHFFFFLSFQIE